MLHLPSRLSPWMAGLALWGCGPQGVDPDPAPTDSGNPASSDSGDVEPDTGLDTAEDTSSGSDSGLDTGSDPCDPPDYGSPGDPFADAVVSFTPGEGAGFGEEDFPEIVLGAPLGGGAGAGSMDVLSLGEGGEIILEFTDRIVVDGPGVDLLVFENPFPGWIEPGLVAVSEDGKTWYEWSCDTEDSSYPGCAGVEMVLSHPDNCIDATDPDLAGGDAFDLADIGLESARYVRIRDLEGVGDGSFDLDAVAVVNGTALER